MRNYFLLCIFLVGLFAIGCSSPPISDPRPDTEQSRSGQAVQAPVIFAQDVVPAVPPADDQSNYLFTSIAGILVMVYEIVVRLIPTTKSISALAFIYKFLSAFIPDRSQNGGTFRIRDKL